MTESGSSEITGADVTAEVPEPLVADRTEIIQAFRVFETAIWKHVNGPDDDAGRRAVAEWVAGELDRVRESVAKELDIVS